MTSPNNASASTSQSTNPYYELTVSSTGVSFLIKNKDHLNIILDIAKTILKDFCDVIEDSGTKIKATYKKGITGTLHRSTVTSLMRSAVESHFKGQEKPENATKNTDNKSPEPIPNHSLDPSKKLPLQSIINITVK